MPSSVAAEAVPAADVANGSKDRPSNPWLTNQSSQSSQAASQLKPPPTPPAAAAATAAPAKERRHAVSQKLHAASPPMAAAAAFASMASKVKGIPEPVVQQAYLSKQDPVSGRLRCRACGKAFELYRQLGQHLLEKHNGLNSQDAKFLKLHVGQHTSQPSLQQQQQQLQLTSADAFPALGASSSSTTAEEKKPATFSAAAASLTPGTQPAAGRLQKQQHDLQQHEQQQQQDKQQKQPMSMASSSSGPSSSSSAAATSTRRSQPLSKPAPQAEVPPPKSLGQFTIFDFIKKPKLSKGAAAKSSRAQPRAAAASRVGPQLTPEQLAALMQAAQQQVSHGGMFYVYMISAAV